MFLLFSFSKEFYRAESEEFYIVATERPNYTSSESTFGKYILTLSSAAATAACVHSADEQAFLHFLLQISITCCLPPPSQLAFVPFLNLKTNSDALFAIQNHQGNKNKNAEKETNNQIMAKLRTHAFLILHFTLKLDGNTQFGAYH